MVREVALMKICTDCSEENPSAYRQKVFEYNLKREFGITPEDYDRMFVDQNGCCAICGRHQIEFKRRLAVDHDRETSKIRGLLCIHCNMGIGQLDHSPECLRKAADYLEGEES